MDFHDKKFDFIPMSYLNNNNDSKNLSMVVNVCNHSTRENETEESSVGAHTVRTCKNKQASRA